MLSGPKIHLEVLCLLASLARSPAMGDVTVNEPGSARAPRRSQLEYIGRRAMVGQGAKAESGEEERPARAGASLISLFE